MLSCVCCVCVLRVACAVAQTLLASVVFKLSSTVTAGEMCNLIRGVKGTPETGCHVNCL